MANVLVQDSSLTSIANAIREKNGETTTYKPAEMAAAISAISTGGGYWGTWNKVGQYNPNSSALTNCPWPTGGGEVNIDNALGLIGKFTGSQETTGRTLFWSRNLPFLLDIQEDENYWYLPAILNGPYGASSSATDILCIAYIGKDRKPQAVRWQGYDPLYWFFRIKKSDGVWDIVYVSLTADGTLADSPNYLTPPSVINPYAMITWWFKG